MSAFARNIFHQIRIIITKSVAVDTFKTLPIASF